MNKSLIRGRAKVSVIDHEGNTVYELPGWQGNLVLNQGLDNMAEMLIADLFKYAAKGLSTTDTRTSPAGNFSQSGNTVTTSSVGVIVVGDVGKLVRWRTGSGAGNEKIIASVTDTTHFEVDGASQTIASGTAYLYAVNQDGLLDENGPRTNNYSQTAGDNSTVTVGAKRTLRRTFIFDAEEASVTYNEIGFSNLSAAGDNLNIRIKLATGVALDGPVGITPGQRLKTTYEMDISVSPSSVTAVNLSSIITDAGNDMSANKNSSVVIETFATSKISTAGATDGTLADLEPSVEGFMALSSDTTAIAFNGNAQRNANVDYVPLSFESDYIDGSYSRKFVGTFDLEDSNRIDLRSLFLYNAVTTNAVLTHLFVANQKKDSNHSLTIEFTKTWNRDLS